MTEDIIDSNDRQTLDTYDKSTVDDAIHDNNKTLNKATKISKEKYGNTIEVADKDRPVQTDIDDEDRNFGSLEKESNDTGKDSQPLPRLTNDEDVKKQAKVNLKAAMSTFELSKLPKEPANDNYRPVMSWPLMDQLTRSTFEPNAERRTEYVVTARHLRELIDLSEADPMGQDSDLQRTENGSVHFDHGMTLDRKKKDYGKKNGESEAQRFDGGVRTAKRFVPVGNSLNSHEPFAVQVMKARDELHAIRSHIGSALWPLLVSAISDNASFTDIGWKLGYKAGQAPPAGSAIIRLALSSAIDALELFNWLRDEPHRATSLPDKSRDSPHLNQARGPVMKVAA